jgi:hypothetical protein
MSDRARSLDTEGSGESCRVGHVEYHLVAVDLDVEAVGMGGNVESVDGPRCHLLPSGDQSQTLIGDVGLHAQVETVASG